MARGAGTSSGSRKNARPEAGAARGRARTPAFVLVSLSGLLLVGTGAESRQADAPTRSDAVVGFGERHPSCAMWTDWRQLCSRTGANGATYCRRDRAAPVAASQPFCVIGEDASVTRAEARSRDRFCLRSGPTHLPTDEGKATGPSRCLEYRSGRPFSGETIDQMRHPACSVWGTGEPGRDICAEDGRDGLPSCASPKVQALRRTDPFVCTAWREPSPCRRTIGGRSAAEPGERGIYVYDRVLLHSSPVWGTYCAKY